MIIGNKEGTFTVLQELEKLRSGQRRFLLKCDCGAEVIKTKSDFKRFNRCKICSYKKYDFEKRGEFECIECNGVFPLEMLKKSLVNYYCCPQCRRKREIERIRRKKDSDKIFKESEKIKSSIYSSLKYKSFRKGGIAERYLGCSKDEFTGYIESLFRGNMSWENREKWNLDHVIPLSTATTSEEIKKLWNYTNLQPLWDWENLEKSDNLDWHHFEWAAEVLEKRKEIGLE